jgi:type IV secretion system protein VirB2
MTPDFADSQPNAIGAAVVWVQLMLVGNFASTLAVIAMAGLGLSILSGRISTQRGIRVVLGCFIVFGSSVIASGLMRSLATAGTGPAASASTEIPGQPVLPEATNPQRPPQPYDPYAGAALPPRP